MENLLLISILTLPFILVWAPRTLLILALGAFVALILVNGQHAARVFLEAIFFLPLVLVGMLVFWVTGAWRRKKLPDRSAIALAHAVEAVRIGAEPTEIRPGAERRVGRKESALIEEQVTVVLRRQIPVRFDEPPRSWFGGCPMMPEDVPWPTSPSAEFPDDGDVYLHFVAQIACADLPAELWGGLGPRRGWLLLFLDAQSPWIDDPPSALQVIHIKDLGPERKPPEGLRPVRNEDYTGYSYDHYPGAEAVPSTWRRWPLDLVTFPNEIEPELPDEPAPEEPQREEEEDPPTPMTPATPYEGARVDGRSIPIYAEAAIQDEAAWPLTWRGALYVVDSVIRNVAGHRPVALAAQDRARFEDPGWPERQVPHLHDARDKVADYLASCERQVEAASDEESRAEAQERLRSWRDRLAGYGEGLQLFEEHRDTAGLLELRARVEASMEAFNDWVQDRLPDLQALRAVILAHDLDSALTAQEFRPLFERLAAMKGACLRIDSDVLSKGPFVRTVETCLVNWARRGFGAALGEAVTELYVKSADARALIPRALRERYEPKWRRVERPHRMGGWHDGIHSEPRCEPSASVLLFQIGADDAMQWSWGDAGAFFVFIEGADLKAGRFDRLQWWHENH